MKILATLLLLNLGVFFDSSGQHQGVISRQENGTYKCAFPEKNIVILFHQHPNIPGVEFLNPRMLDEAERNEFARIIYNSMNLLPPKTLDGIGQKYIYPMHLGRRDLYSLHFGSKILIDAGDLRPGMTYEQHLTITFLYEISAYILSNNAQSEKLSDFLNLLTQYYKTATSDKDIPEMTNMLPYGFVTYRSLGRWSGQYDPRIEFEELFSHLICPETNEEIMQFVGQYPESGLAQKVQHFFDCIMEIEPALSAIIPSEDDLGNPGLVASINGEELLTAHEYRSDQVFGNSSRFEQSKTPKTNEEIYILSSSQEFRTAEEASLKSDPVNFTLSYNETINDKDRQAEIKQQNYIAQRKKGKGGWWLVVLGLLLLSGLSGS